MESLHGDLAEEVYMSLPQGFSNSGEGVSKVCKLRKSLYRLKQASRQWNFKLTETLHQSGFTQGHYDHSLFIKEKGQSVVWLLIYVDDLLIT